MADVYGRLTGKAGVCLSALGPGVWGGEKLDYLNDQLEIYTEADRKRLGVQ